MGSVFDALGDPTFEEWGGQFECTALRCNEWVATAKYHRKTKMLMWKCSHGHVSKMEYDD